MQLPQATLNPFSQAQNKLTDGAIRALQKYFATHNELDAQELADYIFDLTEAGYEVDAELGAQLYDALRALHPNLPRYIAAAAADNIGKEFVFKAVNNAMSTGSEETLLSKLSGSMARWILQGARDTIRLNAASDSSSSKLQVRWARVPQGTYTCGFCIMLASRGFVYATEQSAGGLGNQYHNDCDCLVVPSFEGETLEGYNPDAYYEMYQNMKSGDLSHKYAWNTLMGTHFDTLNFAQSVAQLSQK